MTEAGGELELEGEDKHRRESGCVVVTRREDCTNIDTAIRRTKERVHGTLSRPLGQFDDKMHIFSIISLRNKCKQASDQMFFNEN